jgi:branched-subunit amino acid aminotransferase/4-amino-4-deoxychorismate lyase
MSINLNGTLFDDHENVIKLENRSFRYGDGLFETLRSINGKLPFFTAHFERLLRGMKALQFHIPPYFNPHYMRNEVVKTLESMPDYKRISYRIRLAIFREAGGNYTPTSYNFDFAVEASALPDAHFTLNELGLNLGIYTEFRLCETPISRFKTSNGLPYVLAGIYAKKNSFDDVVFLDSNLSEDADDTTGLKGFVSECVASNIFVLKENRILTPSLSTGCIEGTMRKTVIEMLSDFNITVEETPKLRLNDLRAAEEIFLTSAIQGIRWVENFENSSYENTLSTRLVETGLKPLSVKN